VKPKTEPDAHHVTTVRKKKKIPTDFCVMDAGNPDTSEPTVLRSRTKRKLARKAEFPRQHGGQQRSSTLRAGFGCNRSCMNV